MANLPTSCSSVNTNPVIVVLERAKVPNAATNMATAMPLRDAIEAVWSEHDAHFVAYAPNPEIGAKRMVIDELNAVDVTMVALIGDIDGKKKGPDGVKHVATPEWRAQVEEALRAAPYAWYPTRNGYRTVAVLREPVRIASIEDGAVWSARYEAWVESVRREYGLELDRACKDWGHLFRSMRVLRDGVMTEGELHGEIPFVDLPEVDVSAIRVRPRATAEEIAARPAPSDAMIARAHQIARAQEESVSGSGTGDKNLFKAACRIAEALGGNELSTLEVLRDVYNEERCFPPWSMGVLEHKAHSAAEKYEETEAIMRFGANIERSARARKARADAMAAEAREDAVKARAVLAAIEDQDSAVAETARRELTKAEKAAEKAAKAAEKAAEKAEKVAEKVAEKAEKVDHQGIVDMVPKENVLHAIDRGMWLRWDGSRWTSDGVEIYLERLVTEATEEAQQPRDLPRTNAVKTKLSLAEGVCIKAASLDPIDGRIGVRNGELSLIDGMLAPPDRTARRTKSCAVAYDPDAEDSLWTRVVSELLPPDVAQYVQTALGYAMTGSPGEKAFWFAYGPPHSGKSLFLNAIMHVLGDYAVTSDGDTWLERRSGAGHRDDLVKLMGARLVVAPEIKGRRLDSNLVKQVTGRDAITASAKGEKTISFPVTFALWMHSNSLPTVASSDAGLFERIKVIPFSSVIPRNSQDIGLAARLREPANAAAILAWLVTGARSYHEEGLVTPAAVIDASADYQSEQNELREFAEACLDITGAQTDVVTVPDMRDTYEHWLGYKKGLTDPRAFARALKALGVSGGDDSSRAQVGGVRHRRWFGVRIQASKLKPDWNNKPN